VKAPLTSSPPLPDDQTGELILDLPLGLPGFETSKKFVLQRPPSSAPLACLQSIDSPDLCFLVVPVDALVQDYSLLASPEDLRTLMLSPDCQLEAQDGFLCLAILTAPQEGPLTANLLAPVVVNLAENIAVQAVRADNVYSHRHAVTSLKPTGDRSQPKVPC
jgi:flagellar assembly factor FliW